MKARQTEDNTLFGQQELACFGVTSEITQHHETCDEKPIGLLIQETAIENHKNLLEPIGNQKELQKYWKPT